MGKRKHKDDEMTRFKTFIAANGGEVLTPTNPYEVVRFRGTGITSIIYKDKKESRTFVGEAWLVWEKWKKNETYRLSEATVRKGGSRMAPIDQAIAERDGNDCFFCGKPFSDGMTRTREHLVPATAGGPNHISNLFHAHGSCNQDAGHLSAPEKIRIREKNIFGARR